MFSSVKLGVGQFVYVKLCLQDMLLIWVAIFIRLFR